VRRDARAQGSPTRASTSDRRDDGRADLRRLRRTLHQYVVIDDQHDLALCIAVVVLRLHLGGPGQARARHDRNAIHHRRTARVSPRDPRAHVPSRQLSKDLTITGDGNYLFLDILAGQRYGERGVVNVNGDTITFHATTATDPVLGLDLGRTGHWQLTKDDIGSPILLLQIPGHRNYDSGNGTADLYYLR
jgi:hypothetical protein